MSTNWATIEKDIDQKIFLHVQNKLKLQDKILKMRIERLKIPFLPILCLRAFRTYRFLSGVNGPIIGSVSTKSLLQNCLILGLHKYL